MPAGSIGGAGGAVSLNEIKFMNVFFWNPSSSNSQKFMPQGL
jgi:hypothetical protein